MVCLGVGGLVDLAEILGLSSSSAEDDDEDGGLAPAMNDMGGVEVWVFDARRPWNLGNLFGGCAESVEQDELVLRQRRRITRGVDKGCINKSYTSGSGGIVVYDDGDIEEELTAERDAYLALLDMPEVDEDDDESDGSDSDGGEPDDGADGDVPHPENKKRKSWSGREDEDDSEDSDEPPRQRRKSDSV